MVLNDRSNRKNVIQVFLECAYSLYDYRSLQNLQSKRDTEFMVLHWIMLSHEVIIRLNMYLL